MEKAKESKYAGWLTTKKERISYYIGDNAKSLEGQLVQIFMTTFLLFSGVDLVKVATVTLVLKIIDALDDILFGYIVDRLKPTNVEFLARIGGHGKYLPWYRLTFWMFPLATVLLFQMPQAASDWAKITYFAVFYLLYDLTFTILDVPVNSVVMTLTDNIEERNAIVTNKAIITVLVVIIAVPLMNFLISEHVGMSIRSVVLLMSIVFVILMLPLAFVTKEHNAVALPKEEEKAKFTLKDMLINLINNKLLLILFISNILYATFRTGDSITLFASYYLYGDSQLLVIPILLIMLPTLFMQKYAQQLCKKYDKYKVALIAQTIHFVLRLAVFAVGYKYLLLHIILLTVTAIPSIIHFMATQYMMLDSIEYGRFKSGQECSGFVFSLNSFTSKVTASAASSLCLIALSLFGWVPIQANSFAEIAEKGITQPASAVTGLWVVYAGFWVIGTGLSVLFLAFYRLNNKDADLMAKANSGEISHAEAAGSMSLSI